MEILNEKIVRINLKNREALRKALDEVQQRCKLRLLEVDYMEHAVDLTIKRLKVLGVSKTKAEQAQFRFRNGYGHFANAYIGRPEATWFDFEFGPGGRNVFVTKIYRATARGPERVEFLNEDKFRQHYRFNFISND